MNKLYRLPLRMGSKTQLSDTRRRRKSPNSLIIGILAIGALFALTAMGLAVFGAFKHRAKVPEEVGVTPAAPAADASPAVPERRQNDVVMPLANPNPAPSATASFIHPENDPKASAPELTATPAHSPTPAVPSA